MYVVASNKARYTAQDVPSVPTKITGDGPTDRPTDGRTDGHDLLQRRDGASKKASTTTTIGIRKKRSERKKKTNNPFVRRSVCMLFSTKKLETQLPMLQQMTTK